MSSVKNRYVPEHVVSLGVLFLERRHFPQRMDRCVCRESFGFGFFQKADSPFLVDSEGLGTLGLKNRLVHDTVRPISP